MAAVNYRHSPVSVDAQWHEHRVFVHHTDCTGRLAGQFVAPLAHTHDGGAEPHEHHRKAKP